MKNTIANVTEYVKEEDVKFIRLAFCDVKGRIRNVSVMPDRLESAFRNGISFDGSAAGFSGAEKSDLFLFPDPDTLTLLPWRPSHGRVARLFCAIKTPEGKAFPLDSRQILKTAVEYAAQNGISCNFGTESEFYLFRLDENGERTYIPADRAGYMDVAPQDKCENIRRELCLTIEEMGLSPERSHHEEGPGQNEIDFRYSDALSSADHAVIFRNAAETIAYKNGFWASFQPKPLKEESGSGMHINVSVNSDDGRDVTESFIAGVLYRIKEMTYFLNNTEQSYQRLGKQKAPDTIAWGRENRTALIRIPAKGEEESRRFELRSADGMANIYLAYALILYAGTEGVINALPLQKESTNDLFIAREGCEKLPRSLQEAAAIALNSDFIKKHIPVEFIKI
ncbi:MAG: glutamine synthetase family protein [Candidatus Borkfalkiaceae bacterium]|nr:glutamine synthetase family protein [Clostridia bacterium]MDY6223476.1 glutamine synthetase family protein [Christensenellaceae bacterium]